MKHLASLGGTTTILKMEVFKKFLISEQETGPGLILIEGGTFHHG